jgi:N-acetylglucosamine kinase-like BadF-type ATPase
MKKYVIGVDGGGTKTHYALYDTEGNCIELAHGGPSNHEHFVGGYDDTKNEIKIHTDFLLKNNGLKISDVDYAVFGLAGADVNKQYVELSQRISDLGFTRFKVCNDAFLGVKAGSEKGYGICSINGTGTSCASIDSKGNWLQIGGAGYMFGDEAGGGFLAEMVIRRVHDYFYRCGEPTLMTKMLFEALGITSENEIVEAVYEILLKNRLAISDFSRFAFYAANEGDKVALDLLRHIGRETAKSVIGAIRKLNFGSDEIDVVLAGSLHVKGENPALVDTFKQEILSEVSNKIRFVILNVPPVMGAVLWALEEANGRFDLGIRGKALKSLEIKE